MISKVMIILSNGILCYSKTFIDDDKIDDDFVSGFLTAILDIVRKIGGGEIRSLNFRNFNIMYSYDDEKYCIFILVADIYDPEEELREKLELMKREFIERYHYDLINWDSDIAKFEGIDDFVENNIYIPPKILITGEDGVGKTTIINLFPGELIIEFDEDMNEIIQKSINLDNSNKLNKCLLREINLEDLVNKPKLYQKLLDSVDVICLVTSSGASNLNRTKRLFSLLQPNVKKAQFYVIANFQDLKKTSIEPEKVTEFFGLKVFGFSAITEDSKTNIYSIIKEMLSDRIK
jgi:Cdc6-like AAA superfamily ATPase